MAREKLKEYRISINKTQEEMAIKWGITLSFYKQIECGAKNPSIQKVKDFKNIQEHITKDLENKFDQISVEIIPAI